MCSPFLQPADSSDSGHKKGECGARGAATYPACPMAPAVPRATCRLLRKPQKIYAQSSWAPVARAAISKIRLRSALSLDPPVRTRPESHDRMASIQNCFRHDKVAKNMELDVQHEPQNPTTPASLEERMFPTNIFSPKGRERYNLTLLAQQFFCKLATPF